MRGVLGSRLLSWCFLLSLVLALPFSSGCGFYPRAILRVPPPKAPFAKRMQAYRKLRVRYVRTMGYSVAETRLARNWYALELGDGQTVYRAEDLLPAVLPQSKTAQSIRKLRTNMKKTGMAMGIGIPASFVAGTALMVGGLFLPNSLENSTGMIVLVGTGAVIFLGGMIASVTVGMVYGGRARFYHGETLMTYDRDLLQRLRLKRQQNTAPDENIQPEPRKMVPIHLLVE